MDFTAIQDLHTVAILNMPDQKCEGLPLTLAMFSSFDFGVKFQRTLPDVQIETINGNVTPSYSIVVNYCDFYKFFYEWSHVNIKYSNMPFRLFFHGVTSITTLLRCEHVKLKFGHKTETQVCHGRPLGSMNSYTVASGLK